MKIATDRAFEHHRLRDTPAEVSRVDKGATGKVADARSQADFTRAMDNSHARRKRAGSLRQQLERLSLPIVGNPSLYNTARSIELLQYVIDHVLPRLDTQDEIAELAIQVLNEEIDQRQLWEEARRDAQGEESEESET